MGSNPYALSDLSVAKSQAQLADPNGPQHSDSFAPRQLVALLLDQAAFGPSRNNARPLSQSLTASTGLTTAFNQLPATQQDKMRQALGTDFLNAFLSLAAEKRPQQFYRGLLKLGGRLQANGKLQAAALTFELVAHHSQLNFEKLALQAKDSLATLQGGGNFGQQFQFQFNRLAHEITNPIAISSMAAAGLTYGVVRMGVFRGLAQTRALPWLSRGLGAHATAFSAGLVAESAAFSGVGRGLTALTGRSQDWSPETLKREFFGTMMMLGLLKSSGGVSRWLLQQPGVLNTLKAPLAQKIPQILLPQAAMYSSILATHHFEEQLGWRAPSDRSALAIGALATLIHFNAIGKVVEGTFGPNYTALNRDLHLQANILGKRIMKLGDQLPTFHRPAFAMEGASNTRTPQLQNSGKTDKPLLMMMAAEAKNNHEAETKDNLESDPPIPLTQLISDSLAESEYPLIGETIANGRYLVEAGLGEGGMGVVYQGRHAKIGNQVAIKVLRNNLPQQNTVDQRFLTEAKAASAIKNPHIIDIYDYGTLADGSNYLIMQFLEGKPLSHLIEPGETLPTPLLFNITRQLAEGISAAHAMDIVHRDLKPDNIFITPREGKEAFVTILDFGIAKFPTETKLTMEGAIFGSPEYLSPQQAAGQTVDHRSDIYSFGMILYEMASGRLPFEGAVDAILRQHITQKPMPVRLAASDPQKIPEGLEAIISKCLEKDPDNRYQNMQELLVDLELVEQGAPPSTFQKPVTLPRWKILAGAGGGILAAGGLAALLSQSSNPDPDDLESNPPTLQTGDNNAPIIPNGSTASNTTPSAAQLPSPPKIKNIILTIEPKNAHIFRDGKDLGTSPQLVKIKDKKATEFEIRRKGYQSQTIKIDGSSPTVSIKLKHTVSNVGSGKPQMPLPPPPIPTKPGGKDPEVVIPW